MPETPNRTYRFLSSTFELIFVLHIFETFWKVMISNIRTIFKPLTSNELISSSVTKKQQSRPSSSSVMHPRNQFPFIGRPVRFFSNLAWHLHDKANTHKTLEECDLIILEGVRKSHCSEDNYWLQAPDTLQSIA